MDPYVKEIVCSTWNAAPGAFHTLGRLCRNRGIKLTVYMDKAGAKRFSDVTEEARNAADHLTILNSHAKFLAFRGGRIPAIALFTGNLLRRKRLEAVHLSTFPQDIESVIDQFTGACKRCLDDIDPLSNGELIVTDGDLDFADVVLWAARLLGPSRLLLSTWASHPKQIEKLADQEWLDVRYATHASAQRIAKPGFEAARFWLKAQGYQAPRPWLSHLKLAALESPAGQIGIWSSANLQHNPRKEHYLITSHPLYIDFWKTKHRLLFERAPNGGFPGGERRAMAALRRSNP